MDQRMIPTEPKVHLICRPILDWPSIHTYLESVGGLAWHERKVNHAPDGILDQDGEDLVEFAAKLCYRSWAPGLNANTKKVTEDSHSYLAKILESGHGSVLEHANYTFVFQDVSRVFTHELVRHRAGVAISQESLRYVRLTNLGFRIPEILKNPPTATTSDKDNWESTIVSLIETLEEFQVKAAEMFGLDNDGVPFSVKKEVTSALRRLAPLGLSTSMVWTANLRTLRHIVSMRTDLAAEEEIRYVFHQVATLILRECPVLFGDFEQRYAEGDPIPAWCPRNWKV